MFPRAPAGWQRSLAGRVSQLIGTPLIAADPEVRGVCQTPPMAGGGMSEGEANALAGEVRRVTGFDVEVRAEDGHFLVKVHREAPHQFTLRDDDDWHWFKPPFYNPAGLRFGSQGQWWPKAIALRRDQHPAPANAEQIAEGSDRRQIRTLLREESH